MNLREYWRPIRTRELCKVHRPPVPHMFVQLRASTFLPRAVPGVVLNACNSQQTGKELAALNVPNISAVGRLPDRAARRFSAEFWKAIGKGHTFSKGFQTAIDILSVEGVSGHEQFVFLPGQAVSQQFTEQPAAEMVSESGQFHVSRAERHLAASPQRRGARCDERAANTQRRNRRRIRPDGSGGIVVAPGAPARLAFAVRKRDALLLDKIVTKAPHLLKSPLTVHGERFMTLAAKYGNKYAVRVGIKFGLVNQLKLGAATTPLHTAAYYGQLEIMSMLLKCDGVNPALVSRGGVRFFQMTVNGAEAHKKRRHQIYGALAKLSTSNEWGLKVGLDSNELAEQLAACPHGGLEKLKAHYNEDPELATVFPGISRALRIEPAMSSEHLSMCMVVFVACGVVLLVEVVKRM